MPLAVWLVLVVGGAAAGWGLQRDSRQDLAHRFDLRVSLAADFISGYLSETVQRQREQARAFLDGPVVQQRDFTRSVTALDYPAAVLLDSRGRVLHTFKRDQDDLRRKSEADER